MKSVSEKNIPFTDDVPYQGNKITFHESLEKGQAPKMDLTDDSSGEEMSENQSVSQKACAFFKKYFLEGQEIDEKHAINKDDPNANYTWIERNRQIVALAVPFVIVQVIWWSLMITQDWFHYYNEPFGDYSKPRYWIAVTMIFGSMVAGSTAEGGGAVAFPVMTLALGIDPAVARDFSFMIQSVGMTSAAFTILFMKVKVDMNVIKVVTFSGIFGTIFGLEIIAPELTPAYSKMYFVCIWCSFAVGLYILNMSHGRHVYDRIPHMKGGEVWRFNDYINFNWKRFALVAAGFIGGMCSAISGSGIDICTFSVLTLLFRVDEKVATPTSVVIMGINTVVGFAYRELAQGGVEQEGWYSLACAAPVVVVGAPMGSYIGSHFHRLTLACMIYVLSVFKMIGALVVVRPWSFENTDTPLHLCLTSSAIFIFGMAFFHALAKLGLKLMENIDRIPAVLRSPSSMLDLTEAGFRNTPPNGSSNSSDAGLPLEDGSMAIK